MSVKQNKTQTYVHKRLLETIQRPSLEALAHQNCHGALSNCITHCLAFGERNTYLSEVQTRQSIAQAQGKRMKGQTIYNRFIFLLLNSLVTEAQLCNKQHRNICKAEEKLWPAAPSSNHSSGTVVFPHSKAVLQIPFLKQKN